MSGVPEEDPLDYIDMDDVIQHGNPSNWTFLGPKPGSPTLAYSPDTRAGTTKHYDLYRDDFGQVIEVHYFRHLDGTVENVKIKIPAQDSEEC